MTSKDLPTFVVNYLTQTQYDTAKQAGTLDEDQLYLTPDTGGGASGTVTSVGVQNDTNGGLSVSGSPITTSGTITIGHSNVLTSAQTTQAVYPIKIDKNGHVSAYGTAVTIPTIPSNNITGSGTTNKVPKFTGTYTIGDGYGVTDNSSSTAVTSTDTNLITARTLYYAGYTKNTGTVTGMTTTAGTHTAGSQTVSSGIITTNIPTKTSHLTNDSGFITSDSDEKVKQAAAITTSGAYPVILGYSTATTEVTNSVNKSSTLTYNPNTKELVNGTSKLKSATSTTANNNAYDSLTLGNSVAVSSTTAHSQGQLIIYGSTAYAHTIQGAPSAARTLTLPNATGTIALTSDIPTIPSSTGSNTTGITASTTATKTTLGTANSVTGVQSSTTTASKVTVGSHSTDYGVKAAGSGTFTQGSFSGGSFTQGSFNGGSLTFAVDGTDSTQLNITFTAATHGNDSFTAATHGTDSHTHTAPTLGSKVPTVSASDVTVPIKNTSSTSIPNVSVDSATVSITDPGHTHSI